MNRPLPPGNATPGPVAATAATASTASTGAGGADATADRLADQRRQAALRLVQGAASMGTGATVAAEPQEAPLFEARTSALGGDVDAAGSRLVVWSDRVTLVDAQDRVRAELAIEAVVRVEVRKRLTSVTLVVTGRDGSILELKGVKPGAASRFRDTVSGLRLPGDARDTGSPTANALRRLDELAAMGLLTDKEVADKRALLAQRLVDRRG